VIDALQLFVENYCRDVLTTLFDKKI